MFEVYKFWFARVKAVVVVVVGFFFEHFRRVLHFRKIFSFLTSTYLQDLQ